MIFLIQYPIIYNPACTYLSITYSYGLIEPASQEFTFSNSVVLTLCGLTLKGWNVTPTKASSRLVFLRYVK